MACRAALVVACLLALAGSAWAGGSGSDPSQRKAALDARIAALQGRIRSLDSKEAVLTSEIARDTSRIRALEDDVDRATSRLSRLEGELSVYEARLARLTELFRLQTRKLKLLRRQQAIAERRLAERLVDIYQSEQPTAVEVILSAASLTEMVDALDYVNHLGRQDRRIAQVVTRAKEAVRDARVETARTRVGVQRATDAVRVRVDEQRAVQQRLVASRSALAGARSAKQATLAGVNEKESELAHEIDGLQEASASLAAAIRSAQARAEAPSSGGAAGASTSSGSASGVSSRGFIWPVPGAVTSGFGWRWGRMHEGIDIAAPSGTPIRAAAAGTVIYAGWMSGYGNLVVIDHGGGLATAYAHQSSIGVGNGQHVVQGQTIGYVGCTGHCFGDHLHFEVRQNGSPVDPLGYL
jgi:murein DD-endopeptidase MepM/ murein hydrolase activator NlpD